MEGGTKLPQRYYKSQLALSQESESSVLTDEERMGKYYESRIMVYLAHSKNEDSRSESQKSKLRNSSRSPIPKSNGRSPSNKTRQFDFDGASVHSGSQSDRQKNELLFDCSLENLFAREKEMELLSRQYQLGEVWKNGSLIHELVMQTIHDYEERGINIPSVLNVTLVPEFEAQRAALSLLSKELASYFQHKAESLGTSYGDLMGNACGSGEESNIFMKAMAQCAPNSCGPLLSPAEPMNAARSTRIENQSSSNAVFPTQATEMACELITALEYLRVIYSPQQLKFENFASYLRFKLWSDYLSLRTSLTRWIYTQLVLSPSKQVHIFSISDQFIDNDKVDQIKGNDTTNTSHKANQKYTPLFSNSENHNDSLVIQSFFRLGNPQTEDLVKVIQDDFCDFLHDNLGLVGSFSLEDNKTGQMTLLTIPLGTSKKQKGKQNQQMNQSERDMDESTVLSEITYDANKFSEWIEDEDDNKTNQSNYHFSNILSTYNHANRQGSHASTNYGISRYGHNEYVLDDDYFSYQSNFEQPTSKNLDEFTSDWLRKILAICDLGDNLCSNGDGNDQDRIAPRPIKSHTKKKNISPHRNINR